MAKVQNIQALTFICYLILQLLSIQLKAVDASFVINDSIGCAPMTIYFTNTSTNADSFYWDFNDGLYSTLTNPTHIFYGTGIYTVKLFAFDSLMNIDTAEQTIHIPENKPYFSIPNQACPGQMLSFSIYGNYNNDNNPTWDLGNGFITNNKVFEYSYANPGTYNVTLTVDNPSCGVITDSNEINIATNIVPSIHIHPENADSVICPNENFPFFYDELLPISWDFGNGDSSNDPYPTYSYPNEGTYIASITVSNECGNSNSLDLIITVDSSAIPDAFSFCSSYISCPEQDISFVGGNGFDNTYLWDFDDGTVDSSKTVSHSFSDTGNYNVLLEVTNLCNNLDTNLLLISITDTISPYPWLYIDKLSACPGETINFSGNTNANFYQLDFGDGNYSTSSSTSHSYNDTGVYIIQLSISNECGNTSILNDTIEISSNAIPEVEFSLDQHSYCLNDQLFFISNNTLDYSSIQWKMGDGTTYTTDSIYHIYSDTGTYGICLTITNICGNSDSSLSTITIDTNSTSISSFSTFPSGKICPNTEVSFSNYSTDTLHSIWYFGDGDSSTLSNPKHIYNVIGNAFVQLITTNNCNKTSISTETITITNSLKLNITNLSCITIGDSILFTWDIISEAIGYEASIDNGITWIPISKFTSSYSTHITLLNNFQVRAIGADNCKHGYISSLSPCSLSSIGLRHENNYIELFPNPASNSLTIQIFNFSNKNHSNMENTLQIVDARGNTLESHYNLQLANSIKLDVTRYKPGLYFLIANCSGKTFTGKFSVIK